MKIKWLIEERIVPGIGIIRAGDIIDVPEGVGLSLIGQGTSEEYREKKKEPGIDPEGGE